MRICNFNYYMTGWSFLYFASTNIKKAWAVWLTLVPLETSVNLQYLWDYRQGGVGWFKDVLDGSGWIWRQFLISVMPSREYIFGTRNLLRIWKWFLLSMMLFRGYMFLGKEINASSTKKQKGKGQRQPFNGFHLYPKLKTNNIM